MKIYGTFKHLFLRRLSQMLHLFITVHNNSTC